jgi:Putative DNA-binding domain
MDLPSDLATWTLQTVRDLVDATEFEPLEFDYKVVLNASGAGAEAHNDSIRRTVCAMANTGGGFILFGVKDRSHGVTDSTGRLVGIPRGDLAKQLGEKLHAVQPNVSVQTMPKAIPLDDDSDRGIWVVRVPSSPSRPHMFKGAFPKRGAGGFAALMDVYEVREQMLYNEERMRKLTLFRLELAMIRDLTLTLVNMGSEISRSLIRFDTSSFKLLLADVVSLVPGGDSVLANLLQIPMLANLANQFLEQATYPGMRGMVSSDEAAGKAREALPRNIKLLNELCTEAIGVLDEAFGSLVSAG